ncbi:MAG: hypothetical protein K6U00_13020, partial [Armatimonadetes bacterium]|nr:hypothetical protein [Armatimonadota bacterium]
WGNEYPIMVSTLDNPYRYVGQLGYYTHWMDPSLTDLLHLGVRFYEPGVGRFSQVDPLGYGSNWYQYAAGHPTTAVDPDGLQPTFPGCSKQQIEKIKLHLRDIENNRIRCLTGGKGLQNCIRRRMQDVVIRCDSSCTACGYTVNPTPRKTINLCPDAFDKSKCGCLGSTILHELAHSCTTNDYPGEDPEGYQCEWDCYKKKGSRRCPD